MKQTQKDYERPFLLERTKLDRLLSVIRELLAAQKDTIKGEHFEVSLSDGRRDELTNVDDVLKLDNSRKSKIQRVLITCYASTKGATLPEHQIQVDFDGRSVGKKKTKVTISVRSESAEWADRALSEVEEQVERTWLQDASHRVAVIAIVVSMFVVLIWAVVSASPGGSGPGNKDGMWLHGKDVEHVKQILKQNRTITDEEMREVETRQLSNYVEDYEQNHIGSSGWTKQKVFLSVAALIIFVCGVCLGMTYPSAVFLWGDEIERHNRILLKRRGLWSVVIGTTVIGVVSKLISVALFGP